VHICGSDVLRQRRNFLTQELPVLVWIAILGALEVVVWTESDADAIGANGFGTLLDNLEREAAASLDRSAVLIRSLVDVVVEELVNQISIRAVNLDAIETSLSSLLRCFAPGLHESLNFVHGQRLGWMAGACDAVEPAAIHGDIA
jgi:hypothetical protein